MTDEIKVPIKSEADIVTARQYGRELAMEAGLTGSELTLLPTAISELARNIIQYAGEGEITLSVTEQGSRKGVLVVAEDHGPGISDIDQAMQDGYSIGGGLGLGLPGARRLVDEFEISSHIGAGTAVTMKKWAQ